MLNRREFLKGASALTAMLGLAPALAYGGPAARNTLLLCSSWQTFNIGDIAHTPGVLTILEQHLPHMDVILWPLDVGNGVEAILNARFPNVRIVKSEAEINDAFQKADFFLHGSGPSLVARNHLDRWVKETGKPFGIYGITFPGVYAAKGVAVQARPLDTELLNKADFVYFRDSPSLEFARENGITCPVMAFGPDGTFAVDLHNDAAAEAFLSEHGLEEGKFMCCIPRYRFTEEWLAKGKNRPFNQERADFNEKMKEHDNAPLREAITEVVRQTGLKVMICPEDETHVAIGKSVLFDKLPGDVKAKVVWHDRYWLTDEALSTYRRSAGLFGLEMHSPIICIGQGVPAIVCRFYEQTTKGYMWEDIGLDEWLFDMDQPADVVRLVPAVLAIAKNPREAKRKALKARDFVRQKQKETMKMLEKCMKREEGKQA
ncbi:MAG: polysaccharide pyruvyl transferase family protein [Mangrovibacterium sp.]